MRLGFIGTGNMNSAIISGVVASGFDPRLITITNRTIEKAYKLERLGVNIAFSSADVIENSDVIVLGIKPDDYSKWLAGNELGDTVVVSIGAGITSAFMKKYTTNFVLAMPNTPSKLGLGSTLIVQSQKVSDDIINIFKAVGEVHLIQESEMDRYTLVSGCSPAYFFQFVATMSDIFEAEHQLERETVNKILAQVMEGSAKMLKEGVDPKLLCANVCSPGGVTIEVVNELRSDLPKILESGFAKALDRTLEMKENKQ